MHRPILTAVRPSQGQLYLLDYTLDDAVRLIYLEAVDPHENFYRDLKHS